MAMAWSRERSLKHTSPRRAGQLQSHESCLVLAEGRAKQTTGRTQGVSRVMMLVFSIRASIVREFRPILLLAPRLPLNMVIGARAVVAGGAGTS